MDAQVADRPRRRRLADLLRSVPGAHLVRGSGEVQVAGIAFDSRQVRPGDLFVAVPGFRHDGRRFVREAVGRGAEAVAAESPAAELEAPVVVEVPFARAALADFASAFYGHPSRRLKLIGVTGTDGKSTTVRLCADLLQAQGIACGWLTTVDVKVGAVIHPNDFQHTTPEAPRVQELLAAMVEAGTECAVLEVSSHALALERVRGCQFEVAVFTNLSPEHLNFHGSMEAYVAAKARLFQGPELGLAVLNADDPYAAEIAQVSSAAVVTYGVDELGLSASGRGPSVPEPNYIAREISTDLDGTRFTLFAPFAPGGMRLATRFVGTFNVYNWLAAIAATTPLGVEPQAIRLAASRALPPSGRMEQVRHGQPFKVVVDFSHTPQALEKALDTLRPLTAGRLLAVFGQAGERDPANRRRMGRIAADKADFFVVTSDDPLFEDPEQIARQIVAGAEARGRQAGEDFKVVLDRREAIRLVCRMARAGDTVLLAGKGHERRMLVQDRREPWSDQQAAREALAELGYAEAAALNGPEAPA